MKKILFFLLSWISLAGLPLRSHAQYSVARIWNEVHLNAIRVDAARPPVHARNLFHVCLAMYDAWAAYDSTASTYLLGQTINGVNYPFNGVPPPTSLSAARNEAISYAAYRMLQNRFVVSPNWALISSRLDSTMNSLGYDKAVNGVNYTSGDPAELGNYIAQEVIAMGLYDGANQVYNYAGLGYTPSNAPLLFYNAGNTTMTNVNAWQPLSFVTCIDQNGIPCGTATPSFIGPHWGNVYPFSMPLSSAVPHNRAGYPYPVYYDPGTPPQLNLTDTADASSQFYKWGHSMVAAWSAHLDPNDTTTWDISPKSKGNISNYPTAVNFTSLQSFYSFTTGGPLGPGYNVNPVTGVPYPVQNIRRGDYTRIISQYWADGPTSETPPGHWFTLLNAVSDYPGFQKRIGGTGPVCPALEWDVKTYFAFGAAMHDAAIACWGIKGWYDTPRPISCIRKMADLGQCSNPSLPHYHPGGLTLIPGLIELVTTSDPASLRGAGNVNVNKIKIKSWKGFSNIFYSGNTPINAAGVGWILAENWMPYQRETFVTPPFAGYTSGHSTYSRAGAVMLEKLTGSPYFPGGLGEYVVPANSNFIGFEKSPTTPVKLQWASYKDASDEASLSRIWGGIHPPFDDMPARLIGEQIGNVVFNKALACFNHQIIYVNITANYNNPVCNGAFLSFTATTNDTSSSVIYYWKKNGILADSTYTPMYTPVSYANGDVFACELHETGYVAGSNLWNVTTTSCQTISFTLKLFIEGYYAGNNTMTPVLMKEGVNNDPSLVDSIEVSLHKSSYPYQALETVTVPLFIDGSAPCTFTSPADYYFIAIRHRNAVETWSALPVDIGNVTQYDFSSLAENSYADNAIEVEPSVFALYSGDLNQDGNIDLLDLSQLESDINSFNSGYSASDINGDGNDDLLDSPILESNIYNFISTIQPN